MVRVPILRPEPLYTDPRGPVGSPQPIMQLKELVVDQVRYDQWKASLTKSKDKRRRK